MKFGQFMQYYKKKFFIKKFSGKWDLETSSRSFLIFKDSSEKKKKSEEVSVLIWTNCDSFANTYLMYVACFKKFNFQ